MDFFLEEKSFELEMLKANHYYLTELASFRILNEYDYITEEAKPSFVDKVKNTIDKIITAVRNFLKSIYEKIASYIEEKQIKRKLDELEKSDYDKSKKVTIHSSDSKKALLDKYIQEMTKLERELMDIKGVIYATKKDNKRELAMLQYQKISKKLDDLNDSFDKKFLEDNKDTIELAAKDAIRFSKNSLSSVRVDYEKLEKGSNEILQKFVKDANGCEVPEQANLLVRMGNSIATRVRQFEQLTVKYYKLNLVETLAISAAVGVAIKYVKDKSINKLKAKGEEFLKNNPEAAEKIMKSMNLKEGK